MIDYQAHIGTLSTKYQKSTKNSFFHKFMLNPRDFHKNPKNTPFYVDFRYFMTPKLGLFQGLQRKSISLQIQLKQGYEAQQGSPTPGFTSNNHNII